MNGSNEALQFLNVVDDVLNESEFYADDEQRAKMNIVRKLADVYLLCAQGEGLLPAVVINKNATLAAEGDNLIFIYEEDEVLSRTVLGIFHHYGWHFPNKLQYDCRIHDTQFLPKWYRPILYRMAKDFHGEYGTAFDETELNHICSNLIVRVFHNKKITKVLSYANLPETTEEAKTDINKLFALTSEISHFLYNGMLFAHNIIWHRGTCYFVYMSYAMDDGNGYIDYQLDNDKYLSASNVFRIKQADELADDIIKKYNIPYQSAAK